MQRSSKLRSVAFYSRGQNDEMEVFRLIGQWRSPHGASHSLGGERGESAACVGNQRVRLGLLLDRQKGLVGFGGPGAAEPFLRAAGVIVDRGKVSDGGEVVLNENRGGFAAALQTEVHFRAGLWE